MGLSLTKLFDSFFEVKSHRILMLGLDAAGENNYII